MRRIEADGYAYETDLDLKVGDRVLVAVSYPWRDVFGDTQKRTVTALTTSYSGACERVIRKL